jgi:hypothetical protein
MISTKILALLGVILSAVGIGIWSNLHYASPSLEDVLREDPPCSLPLDGEYDKSAAELVPYQTEASDPYFYAPCPISRGLEKDIVSRFQLIGFEDEKDKRQWQDILQNMNNNRDIDSFKKKIRDFVVTLIKLQMDGSSRLFGAAGSGDLIAFTRVAICDEIAIAHHHIKGGLDPVIGQDYLDNPVLELSKQDRVLFETLYRSCRMTISNAFRYVPCALTRVSFYPTDVDWNTILRALKINAKQPNEVICTYKSRS